MPLKLMYITNNPSVALIAEKYGVDRIWIDLETLGKEERQKGMNSVISHHSISDISVIKPLLHTSEMLVRVNPINPESRFEIDSVINAGADVVMLPMWKNENDVSQFIRFVNGRAKTVLLLETKEAVDCIDIILKMEGIDEIHIGLNDLHLSYHLPFMFQLLSNGMVDELCRKFKNAGIPYGFGGIAKIGEGLIPSEMVILEHYRLGSTRAILSRSFCDTSKVTNLAEIDSIFCENMKRLQAFEAKASLATIEELEENHLKVIKKVDSVVYELEKNKEEGM
jgi:hypothetical protein